MGDEADLGDEADVGDKAGGTRLMLTLVAADGARERLAAALGAAAVAAVVIEPAGARAEAVRGLVEVARAAGAATLVDGPVAAVRAAVADGLHAAADAIADDDDAAALVAAVRGALGRDAVVGVDAAGSRHRGMVAAEAGADYVAFGVGTALVQAEGEMAAREARLDLVAWWAEVFEPACVALDVTSADEAAALAEVGADLVDVRIGPGLAPADVAERVRGLAAALAAGDVRGRAEQDT